MQSRKKKTMKTNTNTQSGAREQIRNTEQNNNNTAAQTAQTQTGSPSGSDKKDNRLPIDAEKRKANRTLPTPKVLNLLHAQLPAAYRLAEVVGKWVWIRFPESPCGEHRQGLSQLGFHWNRERQAWQHPCGKFSLGSQADPHEKYSTYYPARIRRKTKPLTTALPELGSRTSVAAA